MRTMGLETIYPKPRDFTGRLEAVGIEISMDGRGWALDNVFVERLWRTVKYEEVYLHDYGMSREATQRLALFLLAIQ